ncbi:hypothetical protein [Streptomyces sp. MUM 178J]|uniref:hypothetical protein n=1 Tax=Streptomyces sp. MUM 178J TaxID=2791991 RepID=UPI001F03A52E|nr:hypothetical protein [Streptomyces sp. MUM 178J]WRQ79350.1 hypothetical protein I3F59_008205 [Streptomyces sp. MUM 178J]
MAANMSKPPNPRTRHSVNCIEEAEEAVNRLREVLQQLGITLPSLRVEVASYTRDIPCPLIELGRCNVDTARAIAAAVLSGKGGAAQ